MKEITKETFEHYVPAFHTPGTEEDSTVWAALQTHLGVAAADLADRYGTHLPEETDGPAARLLCLSAARRAMAGADIVLTSTGFGVVSNQNLAPASRDRVQALAEELRREESRAADALAFGLLAAGGDWGDTPEAVRLVDSLIWNPTLVRRYGVTASQRREVYAEEYAELLPRIREAEQAAAALISPELMEALVARQRTAGSAGNPDYVLATEKVRRFMAAHLMADRYPGAVRPLARDLLDFVRRHADTLEEWRTSAVREAQEQPRYENTKSDPCFFF